MSWLGQLLTSNNDTSAFYLSVLDAQEQAKSSMLSCMMQGFNTVPNLDYLCNPKYTIWQMGGLPTWNSDTFNNCGYTGNNFGNFGGFGNFGFGSPWGNFQFPWTRQDGQGGSGATAEEKLQYAQYDKMKKILNEYKKVATDSEKAYIEEAMSKSGKIEEKLQALKDVMTTKLDSKVIKESLLSMDPYKTQLIKSGYNVGRNDADAQLLDGIDLAESEIRKSGKVDTLCSKVLSGDDDEKIIKIFSYWNDKFNSKDPKGIIRLIAKHLPSKSGTTADPYVNQKKAVDHIANSLIAQVNKVKATLDKDANLTLLDNSSKEVADALVTASNNFNKENLDKLAAKVDDLYARLRLIEAEKIRNSIQKDYKFVNDMTGKTIVDDNLIIKETEKDLDSEGISVPTNRDAVPSGNRDERPVSSLDDKPVDEQIAGLTQEQEIAETNVKKGIYNSKNSKDEKHHLYMKKDDKLVELKDVVSIDKDNNCKMKDGSTKKLADVEKVEVSPSEIKQYNATLKKIEELKNGGKLVKCPTNLPTWNKAGVTLYWSKGKQANGAHQCFVVMGNELMQIDCKYVDKNGKIIMEDGSTKDITQLTEADCTSVNSSDILATDEPKSTSGADGGDEGDDGKDAISNDDDKKGEEYGKQLAKLSSGLTYRSEELEIIDILDNNINANNVTDVIYGYRTSTYKCASPGIIEQLCGEQGEDAPKIKNIRHIIDALLEAAKKHGITNTHEYRTLQKYVDGIGTAEEVANGSKKYDENEQWESWAIFGQAEAKVIDKLLNKLCVDVRNKEKKETKGIEF